MVIGNFNTSFELSCAPLALNSMFRLVDAA